LNYLYQPPGSSEVLPSIPIAIVQTNIPSEGFSDQEEVLKDFRKKLELTEKAGKLIENGVIVFPEGTNFTISLNRFLNTEGIKNYYTKLSEKEVLVIDNIRTSLDGKNFTSNSIFISSKEGVIGIYGKRILTMAGEYLPYLIKVPAFIISKDFIDWFSVYRQTAIGDGSDIVTFQGKSIKILVCSDILYPSKAGKASPNIIIVTGSYAIWNGDKLAQSQILATARMRAIENKKYLVLAANSDRSYIIDPLGNTQQIGNPQTYELLTGRIVPNKTRTWYNYVGDWPILILSSVIFGVGIKGKRDDIKS